MTMDTGLINKIAAALAMADGLELSDWQCARAAAVVVEMLPAAPTPKRRPRQAARTNDPETSRLAAERALARDGGEHGKIVDVLRAGGPMIREMIVARVEGHADSRIRTAVRDLIDAGIIEKTGKRATTTSGASAEVLRLTKEQ